MSILKEDAKKILLSDWLCPEIVDREEEVRELDEAVFHTLLTEQIPPITFVYGASGTGKTFIVKRLFKDRLDEIRKHLPRFNYFYLNVREFEVASLHAFWVFLSKKLENYLPIYSDYMGCNLTSIPARGWQTDDYKAVVKEIIKSNALSIVVILDEVDKMNTSDFESLVYQVHGFGEDLPDYIGISVIAISNKINFLKLLSKPVFDRIAVKVHFKSYTVTDLFQILKVHAKYSLKEGSYDDETLLKIAKTVFDISTSARDVKLTLYNLAKMSNDKLDGNLVIRAFEETKKDLISEEIRVRPLHHKLALYSVIKFYQQIKEAEELGKKARLLKYAVPIPTISNIYKVYVNLCKQIGEKSKSYRTFFDIIDDLDKKGLIRKDVQSLGRARGITTIVQPIESVKFLEPIVRGAIGL